jgi:hypothetical protein
VHWLSQPSLSSRWENHSFSTVPPPGLPGLEFFCTWHIQVHLGTWKGDITLHEKDFKYKQITIVFVDERHITKCFAAPVVVLIDYGQWTSHFFFFTEDNSHGGFWLHICIILETITMLHYAKKMVLNGSEDSPLCLLYKLLFKWRVLLSKKKKTSHSLIVLVE